MLSKNSVKMFGSLQKQRICIYALFIAVTLVLVFFAVHSILFTRPGPFPPFFVKADQILSSFHKGLGTWVYYTSKNGWLVTNAYVTDEQSKFVRLNDFKPKLKYDLPFFNGVTHGRHLVTSMAVIRLAQTRYDWLCINYKTPKNQRIYVLASQSKSINPTDILEVIPAEVRTPTSNQIQVEGGQTWILTFVCEE